MTIDSGWVRVMKEEAPEAFRSTYPFKGPPAVAYIDGMPLLMISEKNVRSWDDLLRNNYARHIQRYFKLGCRAVVLAFDDYDRVPASKAITQANRSKKKAAYEFGEGQQLPPTVPHGYNEKLSNRIFKRRVIDMVCNCVVRTIALGADTYTRHLVIDYTGCPVQFDAPARALRFDSSQPPLFMADVPPMGEADIKFLRWSDHFGGADMIAFSVDGDFIPIALMRREQQLLQFKLHQQAQREGEGGNEDKQPPPRVANIAIFRIKYKAPQESRAKKEQQQPACKRQKLLQQGQQGQLGLVAPAPQTHEQKKAQSSAPREWEYVDIPKLHAAMQEAFARLCPSVPRNPLHRYHYMRMLAALIALSGTDFSRGLPFVGPATLWAMLGERAVFSALLRAYDLKTGLLDTVAARDALACNVYMHKFATHFRNSHLPTAALPTRRRLVVDSSDSEDEDEGCTGFRAALDVLRTSSLSERTRCDLPSALRVEVTMRNINWLLQYWGCVPPVPSEDGQQQGPWDYSRCYPNPICEEYGFKARSSAAPRKKKGAQQRAGSSLPSVQWLDEEDAEESET